MRRPSVPMLPPCQGVQRSGLEDMSLSPGQAQCPSTWPAAGLSTHFRSPEVEGQVACPSDGEISRNRAGRCLCDLPEGLCDLMGCEHTSPHPEEQGGLRSEGQQAGSQPEVRDERPVRPACPTWYRSLPPLSVGLAVWGREMCHSRPERGCPPLPCLPMHLLPGPLCLFSGPAMPLAGQHLFSSAQPTPK